MQYLYLGTDILNLFEKVLCCISCHIRLVQIANEWCYISRTVLSDVKGCCLSFGPVYSALVLFGLLLVLVLGHISVWWRITNLSKVKAQYGAISLYCYFAQKVLFNAISDYIGRGGKTDDILLGHVIILVFGLIV